VQGSSAPRPPLKNFLEKVFKNFKNFLIWVLGRLFIFGLTVCPVDTYALHTKPKMCFGKILKAFILPHIIFSTKFLKVKETSPKEVSLRGMGQRPI
jgi:hypothetical protein